MRAVPQVRRRRRDRKRPGARHRRTCGGPAQGNLPSKGAGEPARRPGRLRSVREARELRGRAQRRLHQLVALGRREHHRVGEGQSDHALHLSGVARHRRGRAGGRGRRGAVARGALLERRVPERHRRSKILAEGNARANPGAMARGASRPAAAAAARLQRAVTSFRAKVGVGRVRRPGVKEQSATAMRCGLASASPETANARRSTAAGSDTAARCHSKSRASPTPQEAPKSEPPPDIPAPGPDVIREPGPDDIPETFPPEAPPPVTFAV